MGEIAPARKPFETSGEPQKAVLVIVASLDFFDVLLLEPLAQQGMLANCQFEMRQALFICCQIGTFNLFGRFLFVKKLAELLSQQKL